MRQSAVHRFSLLQELHVALTTRQLSMHYQPIVELASGRVVGFESLMRWRHREHGWISPEVFIPLAERSSLIDELGTFALRTALKEARAWADTRGAPYVSVNVSAVGFHDPGLVGAIEDELRVNGVAPSRLVIEITESAALIDVTETLDTTKRLQEMGVRVALDDFGTGYSSLSQLAQLRPDILKIDRSFVNSLHASPDHDALLEAIITLGAKLDMTVLAEGIETPEQRANLHSLGCALGQGFYFSPAVPREHVTSLLGRAFAH
jgi:EAL domain-containing protein (putative c-di-GMP-specific phosphodiesterase class I)